MFFFCQIYFCSRTHSQLAQFVREIQKSPFGEDTRVVSLGSRQNLCINDAVRRLKSSSLINDRCVELQRKKSSKKTTNTGTKKKKLGGGCPFYKQEPMLDLRDRALVSILAGYESHLESFLWLQLVKIKLRFNNHDKLFSMDFEFITQN